MSINSIDSKPPVSLDDTSLQSADQAALDEMTKDLGKNLDGLLEAFTQLGSNFAQMAPKHGMKGFKEFKNLKKITESFLKMGEDAVASRGNLSDTDQKLNELFSKSRSAIKSLSEPKEKGSLDEATQEKLLPLLLKKLNKYFSSIEIDIFKDLGSLTLQNIIQLSLLDLYMTAYKASSTSPKFSQIEDSVNDFIRDDWSDKVKTGKIFQKFISTLSLEETFSHNLMEHLNNSIIPLMKLSSLYDNEINGASSTIKGVQFISSTIAEVFKVLQPVWSADSAISSLRDTTKGLKFSTKELGHTLAKISIAKKELRDEWKAQNGYWSHIGNCYAMLSLLFSYSSKKAMGLYQIFERVSKVSKTTILEINYALKLAEQCEKSIDSTKQRLFEMYRDSLKYKKDIKDKDFDDDFPVKQIDNNPPTFFLINIFVGKLLPVLQSAMKGLATVESRMDGIDLEFPEILEGEVKQAKDQPAKNAKCKRKIKKENKVPVHTTPAMSEPDKDAVSKTVVKLLDTTTAIKTLAQTVTAFSQQVSQVVSNPEILPVQVKKLTLTRSQLAQQQQLYANACIASILELQNEAVLTKEQQDTLRSFSLLWSYIASEQALTAPYVHHFPNDILVHRLSFLLNYLELPKDSLWIKKPLLDRQSIGFRYGHAAGLKEGPSKEAEVKEAADDHHDLIQQAFALQMVALRAMPHSPSSEVLAKLLQHFAKLKKESESIEGISPVRKLSDDKLQTQEKHLSETLAKLEEMIKKVPESAEVAKLPENALKDIYTHLRDLRNLISLVASFGGDPRFGFILFHMILLSSQYLVENIGLHLVYRKGQTAAELWDMNVDLHDLDYFCKDCGLDKPLSVSQKSFLNMLNIGNKGTYLHSYFARTDKKDISKIVLFLNELYERSKVAVEAGADFTPGKMREAYLPKLIDYCNELASLCHSLTTHHLA